jgi:hypothetical protein
MVILMIWARIGASGLVVGLGTGGVPAPELVAAEPLPVMPLDRFSAS